MWGETKLYRPSWTMFPCCGRHPGPAQPYRAWRGAGWWAAVPAPRTHPLRSSTSGGWQQSGSSLGSSSLPATVKRGTRAAMLAEPTIMLKLPVLPSPLPRSVPFQSLYCLCPNSQLPYVYSIHHITDSWSSLGWKRTFEDYLIQPSSGTASTRPGCS